MKKLFSYLMAFTTLWVPIWGAVVEPIEHPAIEEVLNQLPHKGFLVRGGNNSIILKVSEEYLDKLFPILVEIYGNEGLVKGSATVGAHVSVNRPSIGEPILGNIPELNQVFEFTPIRLSTVVPDLDPKWERVWILEISAPELEALRVSNGLSPRLGNTDNEFHITIATKLREDLISQVNPLN